ncbi:MAG: zinc-ribbon domain-containing protein [Lachnospiraceae bacterium]|nr:zinc-ribbon domain-containing protein [Lachnospiraceae bacterium]MBR1568817.1 zinc-ribbon domain-containing protein [Lachnospiraceae bacterium]
MNMVCPNCGQKIIEGNSFCVNCGTPISIMKNDQNEMQNGSQTAASGDDTQTGKLIRSQSGSIASSEQPTQGSAQSARRYEQPIQEFVRSDQRTDSQAQLPKKKSKAWLIILIIIATVLFVGIILLVVFILLFYPALRNYKSKSETVREQVERYENNNDNHGYTDYSHSSDTSYASADITTTGDTTDLTTTELTTEAATTEATTEAITEAPKEYEHRYEIIVGDITWTDAKAACEARGGYLATITSEEEYDQICALADQSNVKYLWLGANIHSVDDTWGQNGWLTGEAWTYERWYPGEPSKTDLDGTEEFYLCMWKAKMENETEATTWTFNDQRNDIVGAVPSISGKLGYVLEYEVEVQP